jgi:hypothetical protein
LGPNGGFGLQGWLRETAVNSLLIRRGKGKKIEKKETAYLAQRDCSQFSAGPEKEEHHD